MMFTSSSCRPPPELADNGPLKVEEFLDLRRVDTWFAPNPATKKLANNETYATDYAILRDPKCSKLVSDHCPMHVIDDLVRCEGGATRVVDVDACMEKATAACGRPP